MLLPISVNCAVMTLSTRCSRTTLSYQSSWTSTVLYSSRQNVLLPISENLCSFVLIEFAVLYKCWKNCWMNPKCQHYSLYSWRKSEQVLPRDVFLPKRLFQIFFHSYNTLFWVVSASSYCSLKTYQFLIIYDRTSVFSKQFYHCYFIQFFRLVAKIAINFSN